MKTIFRLVLLCFILSPHENSAQQLHPVKDNIACLWGLKDDLGKWVVPAKYVLIDKTQGNFFIAMINEKWGVISNEGKELVPFIYDKLNTTSELNINNNSGPYLIYAVKKGKSGLINSEGTIKIPFVYDALGKDYYHDYFHIQIGKKHGIRNYEKELLPCKYTVLDRIEWRELFVAGSNDSASHLNKNMGVIDVKGDTLIPFQFTQFSIPKDNYYSGRDVYNGYKRPLNPLIVAVRNELSGLYTFEGKCMLEPRYRLSKPAFGNSEFTSDHYNYKRDDNTYASEPLQFLENGKYGIILPGKGEIQPAVFESVFLYLGFGKRPAIFTVLRDGKWGLLNKDGTELLACNYRSIAFHFGHIFVGEKEDRILEFNWRTKKMEARVYQKILPATNHINLVSDGDFYDNYNDSVISRCEVLATFSGNISVLNSNDAIEGKGSQAERVQLGALGYNRIRYFAISTKNGVLLCDNKYKPIIPPNRYQNFTDLKSSGKLIVTTKSNKVGVIDSIGKLVVDTIFEAIEDYLIKGLMFVKPLQKTISILDKTVKSGWALADLSGKLLTEPTLYESNFYHIYTYQFLTTKNGVGVFDFNKRRFIIPATFKNGFFTDNGDIIMQKRNGRFALFTIQGKLLSGNDWQSLVHLSRAAEKQFYDGNGYEMKEPARGVKNIESNKKKKSNGEQEPLEDVWLLINGDTLAILNENELIYNKRNILDKVYTYFVDAYSSSQSGEYNYFHQKPQRFSRDCPQLNTGIYSLQYLYDITPTGKDLNTNKNVATNKDSIAVNDSLVLRMIYQIAPKAKYELYPKLVGAEEDIRQEHYHEPSSYYYRVMHRAQNLISLQILDGYGDMGPSIHKDYFNKSAFENYFITENRWEPLTLQQLFKPGFEVFLNAEIVRAIQKADTLEIDCNNPASYLEQCAGRFSFSKQGLWLYLESRSGYEFIPQLIPWQRLASVIPKQSVAFSFLEK